MQLVDRTLAALTILCQSPSGLSVSELSLKLEIPASSTHRILSSLKNNNFIVQDKGSKKYSASYKMLTLCSGLAKDNSLIMSARPVMKALSKQIGKTIVLCIMENQRIINIDCIEREDSSMYMVKTGIELPMYATSAGRVFSAYMDREKVIEIFGHTDRKQATPYTKTDLTDLFQELDEIKKQGYALIDEELQLGIQGAACPIFDIYGHVIAALAFTCEKREWMFVHADIEQLSKSAGEITNLIS